MVAGEFVALLATARLAEKFPLVRGEKVTCKGAVWLGARIKPEETPVTEYLAPDTLTFETVTSLFPAFVSVLLKVVLAPRDTLPKFKVDGAASRSAVAATPIPLTETALGEPEASLRTDTTPVTPPALFGENTTLNADCFPGARFKGSEIPVMATPLTVVLAWVTERFALPLLAIVTDWEATPPTATVPKLTDAGESTIAGAGGPF